MGRSGRAAYLRAPQASELLGGGEVWAAHLLPQQVRVAHEVVQAIRDVRESCGTDRTG